MKKKSKKYLPRWLIAGIVLFAATIAVVVKDRSCRRAAEVDMNQVVSTESSEIEADPTTLRVAVAAMISPETTREFYQELFNVIAKRVGRRAIFSQRRTYEETNELIKMQKIDIAFVCSGPYVSGHDDFGMEILAVPVANKEKVYYSYILAPSTNQNINSFDDLKGHRFAFTDPESNTGTLVPIYMLSKKGETVASFFSSTFYTYSHDNSIRAIANGQADGAAVDSLIWEFMNAIDPKLTSRTKIIAKSAPYGIPPVVVHPALDSKLKAQLKNVLLTLYEDEEAAHLLRSIRIERFEEADDSEYNSIREIKKWTKQQKGSLGR